MSSKEREDGSGGRPMLNFSGRVRKTSLLFYQPAQLAENKRFFLDSIFSIFTYSYTIWIFLSLGKILR